MNTTYTCSQTPENTQHNRSNHSTLDQGVDHQPIAENGPGDDGLIRFLILSKVREGWAVKGGLRFWNPCNSKSPKEMRTRSWLRPAPPTKNLKRTILTSSLTLAGTWGRTVPKQASDLVECRYIRKDQRHSVAKRFAQMRNMSIHGQHPS